MFKIVHSKQNVLPSPGNPERFDQPDEALTWLKMFQTLNGKHLPQVVKKLLLLSVVGDIVLLSTGVDLLLRLKHIVFIHFQIKTTRNYKVSQKISIDAGSFISAVIDQVYACRL